MFQNIVYKENRFRPKFRFLTKILYAGYFRHFLSQEFSNKYQKNQKGRPVKWFFRDRSIGLGCCVTGGPTGGNVAGKYIDGCW